VFSTALCGGGHLPADGTVVLSRDARIHFDNSQCVVRVDTAVIYERFTANATGLDPEAVHGEYLGLDPKRFILLLGIPGVLCSLYP
jgi:hypothetical protein